ncbi:uncharacterized protein SOCE26_078950 [Sorangium cellulosum]|uniref:Uncharacterized protein n=1 Tax=Sorangium cellulosum TaxID=56 RepID=A0A2L0F4L1_SORCE|nr:uncharacterized protein SOCE26_078950 [Sorangium cellulosum]
MALLGGMVLIPDAPQFAPRTICAGACMCTANAHKSISTQRRVPKQLVGKCYNLLPLVIDDRRRLFTRKLQSCFQVRRERFGSLVKFTQIEYRLLPIVRVRLRIGRAQVCRLILGVIRKYVSALRDFSGKSNQ